MDQTPCLIGRSSSHYTRVARMIAVELGVAYRFQPVFDLASRDAADYGGSPAMKLPVLQLGEDRVFGTENICRTLAEHARDGICVVWTEDLPGQQARNAQELVWHGMATQVQWVFGTQACGLPADNVYFAKAAQGMRQVLAWLDRHLDAVLATLPPRGTSLFEVTLFCLLEHLRFRSSFSTDGLSRLDAFVREFARRPSAIQTTYRFDQPAT